MSNIKNEPKIKNPLIVAIREQLEHRALWMYLLCDEAKKKGLPPEEYAPAAIKRCGLYQGANLRAKAGGGDSLKGLKKTLFSKAAQWVFEMDIKRCTDDNLDIDFHYCPLVKAWQKQGCSDEEIQMLCDHAMCGDHGIAESFGCHLELPSTIAYGADIWKNVAAEFEAATGIKVELTVDKNLEDVISPANQPEFLDRMMSQALRWAETDTLES